MVGIVGYNNGATFTNCINNGNIDCEDNSILDLGGIAGYNDYWNNNPIDDFGLARIESCTNKGNITGKSLSILNIGGISGYNEKGTEIVDSLNNGKINAIPTDSGTIHKDDIVGYEEE